MDAKTYLERIDYHGSLSPTTESLRELQLAHLMSVPFENLSIHADEPIILRDDLLFDKVVRRRRGGFCYELNGLFAALLRHLGFNVSMLSAEVTRPDGSFAPEFDHMTLMVSLEERWLVDVGFGDSFRQPLLLDSREVQVEGERSYLIEEGGGRLILKQREAAGEWKAQYRFTLQSYEYADYAEMCRYHQTSPESPFTQRRLCSIARPDGRVTLSGVRFIETKGSERREETLVGETAYAFALEKHFGIKMPTLTTRPEA